MSIYPYPASGSVLQAVSWPHRLKTARTEAEVVDVARDFLATFSPYDLARLPEVLRPGRLVDGADVNDVAYTLVRHDHDDSRGTARCIHRLTNFFTSASVRLTELLMVNPGATYPSGPRGIRASPAAGR
jgi:hypothetical protein